MTRLTLATLAILIVTPLAAAELPPICTANARQAMDGGMGAMAPEAADAPHQDLMAGMDKMNADMTAGASASDIDVAFVCGMIPHHQGAIDMARAELTHGDDPWAREMAQNVIDAQEKEIAEMLDWLGRQPQ